MKKIYLSLILLAGCLLSGCGSQTEKLCRIEIWDEGGTKIAVLEQYSQAEAAAFFDEEAWTAYERLDEKLVPKYVIELYQEKTDTLVGSDGEDAYEKIMEYTVYRDSHIVKAVICEDAIKSGFVPEEDLTFYYRGSEGFFASLNEVGLP